MKDVHSRSADSLEDQMWDGLGDAFLGGVVVIVTVVLGGGLCAVASIGTGPVAWVLWAIAVVGALAIQRRMGFRWREAHGELRRRRLARENAEDMREEAKWRSRPRSTQAATVFDPSRWTG